MTGVPFLKVVDDVNKDYLDKRSSKGDYTTSKFSRKSTSKSGLLSLLGTQADGFDCNSMNRSTVLEIRQACPYEDSGNVVAWAAFLYGFAVTTPFNFITFTLSYFDEQMPDYPIDYVVSFAVNGVMVIVILICLA